MNTEQATCFCAHCRKNVTFHFEPINHMEHLRLTIFTLGLWLPIWLFTACVKSKVCDTCEEPLSE